MLLPPKFKDVFPLTPGRNAKVFKAINSFMGRPAFLKIYPIPTDDPLSSLAEPKALQDLNHEHIAKIYDAHELEDQQLLLEMELVTGGSLQDIVSSSIKSGSWQPIHQCLDLINDIASGLSYLHSKGYIHQDIKPANLLIRNPGAHGQGIVADLGSISKIDEDGRAQSGRHSRLYRPPEAWNDLGYSAASDVYQLGIVLFQLLGGTIDYSLSDLPDQALGDVICRCKFIQISSLGPHIGKNIRDLLESCICPEKDRIQTIVDFTARASHAKLKQNNWKLQIIQDGFSLSCPSPRGGELLVKVYSNGKNHKIHKFSRTKLGEFRRVGKPTEIVHPDLTKSNSFKKLISI